MNRDRTGLDRDPCGLLRSQIARFADEYGMAFANMAECRAMALED